jgi:hypothetical protein
MYKNINFVFESPEEQAEKMEDENLLSFYEDNLTALTHGKGSIGSVIVLRNELIKRLKGAHE